MKVKRLVILIFLMAAISVATNLPFAEAKDKYVLKDIDLSDVTKEQEQRILKILRGQDCPCNCCRKGDLVACRNADDVNCGVSKKMATMVKTKVLGGEEDAKISQAVSVALKKIMDKRKRKAEKYNKVYDIDTEGANYFGKADARLSLIVFLDFECPYCTTGYMIYKALVREFPDDLRFVFMHNPLAMHKGAVEYAAAAEAAGAQGKFFEMADLMMAKKGKYSDAKVILYAEQLGLDMEKFKKDMIDVDILTKVFICQEEARRHGISATPTVIMNNKMIRNKNKIEYFREIVQKELNK